MVWPLWSHGFVPVNPLQLLGVPGPWSALPYLAALAAAIAVLLLRSRRPLHAAGLALILIAAQWLAPALPGRGAAHYLADQWAVRPPGAIDF